MSPQETELDLLVSVQDFLVEMWFNSLASGQQQEGNTATPIKRKLD